MKKSKDYTILALCIPFIIAVLFSGALSSIFAKATENRARAYDYGIVKKGDTLFIYKDNKPIGCDIGGEHCIGDILRIEGKGDN